jgi:hypothetical protein
MVAIRVRGKQRTNIQAAVEEFSGKPQIGHRVRVQIHDTLQWGGPGLRPQGIRLRGGVVNGELQPNNQEDCQNQTLGVLAHGWPAGSVHGFHGLVSPFLVIRQFRTSSTPEFTPEHRIAKLELPKLVKPLVRVLNATGEMTGSGRAFNVSVAPQVATVCEPRAENQTNPLQVRNCKEFDHDS